MQQMQLEFLFAKSLYFVGPVEFIWANPLNYSRINRTCRNFHWLSTLWRICNKIIIYSNLITMMQKILLIRISTSYHKYGFAAI